MIEKKYRVGYTYGVITDIDIICENMGRQRKQ